VNFSEALTELKAGQKVRRTAWAGTLRGLTLELAYPPPLEGRPLMPQLLVQSEDGILRPFSGANWDLLAEDWEVVP
jgi:Protein of unknown function (DUF2829)